MRVVSYYQGILICNHVRPAAVHVEEAPARWSRVASRISPIGIVAHVEGPERGTKTVERVSPKGFSD